jgi:hypothetical protein
MLAAIIEMTPLAAGQLIDQMFESSLTLAAHVSALLVARSLRRLTGLPAVHFLVVA